MSSRSAKIGGCLALLALVLLARSALAADVATLCGARGAAEPLIRGVFESSFTKAFTRAQTVLGIPHRSIYQAKHTFATLELEAGGNPAAVARNLGIGLSTLTKHYAAALQKGMRADKPYLDRGMLK